MNAQMAANVADGGNAEHSPELGAFRWFVAANEDSSGGGNFVKNPELSAFQWFQAQQEADILPLLCRVDC
jgi:hypothetical protein